MNAQTNDHPEEKKTWQTPELVVYGDIEKITGERPSPPGGTSW